MKGRDGEQGDRAIQGRETEFNVPLQWVTRGCNCRSGRNGARIAAMGVVRWLHRVDTDISATTDETPPRRSPPDPVALPDAGPPRYSPSWKSSGHNDTDLVRRESLDRSYLSPSGLYSSNSDAILIRFDQSELTTGKLGNFAALGIRLEWNHCGWLVLRWSEATASLAESTAAFSWRVEMGLQGVRWGCRGWFWKRTFSGVRWSFVRRFRIGKVQRVW